MNQINTQTVSPNSKPGSKYFPDRLEIKNAFRGLITIVLPITIISELIWYLEIKSNNTFFVDIFIAAVLTLILTNLVKVPDHLKAGPAFAQKWFLRLGIILYGFKFSYGYLVQTGWQNLIIVIAAVVSAILVSFIVGRMLGLDEKTSALIGNGTAVCGITAAMATAPSIKAREEHTSIAIGVILMWGTFALFIYPLISAAVNMPAAVYGAWAGAAIHDLPQIIAAAKQVGGNEALDAALMVKMIRIAFIVIVVLGMNIIFTVKEQRVAGKSSEGLFLTALRALPGFVIAFFIVVLINTLVEIPKTITGPLATYPAQTTPFTVASLLLTMAIIGICWQCKLQIIKAAGSKAVLTGMISFAVQSILVLTLAYAFFA